jgi:hypothetical protein
MTSSRAINDLSADRPGRQQSALSRALACQALHGRRVPVKDGLGVAEVARQAHKLAVANDRGDPIIVLNRNKNLISHDQILPHPGRTCRRIRSSRSDREALPSQ